MGSSVRRKWWFSRGILGLFRHPQPVILLPPVTAKRDALMLEAFRHYAAATERARIEDWPDDAWRVWRYRRASIARLLEREGMMREVAEAFERVKKSQTSQP